MSPAAAMDASSSSSASASLREKGNDAFKRGQLDEARRLYSEAIGKAGAGSADEAVQELAVLFKNRAAVFLRQERFEEAIADCDESLKRVPGDPKALYRRCQAHDATGQVEKAYKDAREVHQVDPGNQAIQPYLARLHAAVAEKVSEMSKVSNKAASMTDIVFDPAQDLDKRQKAADNLVVLARDRAGADALHRDGVVQKIAKLVKVEKEPKIRLSLIRCISEFAKKDEAMCGTILQSCGIPFFLDVLNSKDDETVHATSYAIQKIMDTLSNYKVALEIREKKKTPRNMTSDDRKWCIQQEEERAKRIRESKELDSIFRVLVHNSTSRTITGEARDAIVELLMKNCRYDELGWAEALLKTDGYQRLMEVASEMTEYKHESSMEVTHSTRAVAGVCLSFCYEAMYDDKRRNALLEKVDAYVQEQLLHPSLESKVRLMSAITTLLQHAVEIGQAQIAKEGILQMMLTMARSGEYIQQLVASEAIIAATQKKKDSNLLITQGIDIVKQLYHSKDNHIKVRALVAMCKMGASAGHDASLRPFADGSTEKLAEACRRFLVNPGKDRDLKKWAAEGLSYLTLDADVKEKLCEDEEAFKAMIELAKEGKADCTHAIITLLVNVTNSFDKEEIMPEMLELAKFAKHHIPEEHEMDDQDFIDKRIYTVANYGVTSALVALSKTESKNVRELISRVLNAICKHAALRGKVVQQGGTKVLADLALDGTEKGQRQAAQALARIGITQDPSIAFPGQRAVDVIRPVCQLLNVECSGMENFEALMALGNLASLNESTRKRILKEKDFVMQIEGYMFEEHQMIRRAAVQCFTNLCASELQVQRCEGKNDKVKYVVLLCGDDEDVEVVRAASGALAMLTSQSEKVCRKVFDSSQWRECLLNLLANPDLEIVLRGCVVVRNMMRAGRDVAEKIIETDVMDCMQAHIFKAQLDEGSYEPDPTLKKVRSACEEALKTAHDLNLVKTKAEAEKEDKEEDSD